MMSHPPVFPGLSAESCSGNDRCIETDPPGEKGAYLAGSQAGKQVTVLQEKFSLLGEIEFKTVQVCLLPVHLHLRVIRIDGNIQVHGSGKDDLGIQTGASTEINIFAGFLLVGDLSGNIGNQ